MKKYLTSKEFKKFNSRHAARLSKRERNHKRKIRQAHRTISGIPEIKKQSVGTYKLKSHKTRKPQQFSPSISPDDFRLIENTEACLTCFREIRSPDHIQFVKNSKYVPLSLKNVTAIDYGTISILTAIGDDLKSKNIFLHGNFPDNLECKNFIIESGFLNNMVDEKNHKFPSAEKSEMIFFEKGAGALSEESNRKISELVKKVVSHITAMEEYSQPVKTIILEICGNSIEWSGTDNKQWLLGVKYEVDKVIFTATDVGKGILDSLYRKFSLKLADFFSGKSPNEILYGAFIQKYGSTTQEENRNKGLPIIKNSFINGTIKNLKVLTNNVILHFDDETISKTFEKGSPRFKGTFYQWEMDRDCLNKIIK
jgi:hypothetical protein